MIGHDTDWPGIYGLVIGLFGGLIAVLVMVYVRIQKMEEDQ